MLDLTNAILPWSSSLFAGLSELHLDFRQCEIPVEISEEELLEIFEDSPQLESLSLFKLELETPTSEDDELQYIPVRVVELANLKSIDLDCHPTLIGYILHHIDIPAISYLNVVGDFSSDDCDVEGSLEYIFHGDHLPRRLITTPPIFEVWSQNGEVASDAFQVTIGSCHIQVEFSIYEETVPNKIMDYILQLAPPSVTALKLSYSQLDVDQNIYWTGFFSIHPEVHSIEFSRGFWTDSWNALSSVEGKVRCPKLESITLSEQVPCTSLLDCLTKRKAAGYGLKRLELVAVGKKMARELSFVVEKLQVIGVPIESMRRVSLIFCL